MGGLVTLSAVDRAFLEQFVLHYLEELCCLYIQLR